jgi:hypothetical protein
LPAVQTHTDSGGDGFERSLLQHLEILCR